MNIKLYFEFGFYPVWIEREEFGDLGENVLPKEWESDKELVQLNEEIGDMWTSFYIDEVDKPFEFVGPKSAEEKELFRALSEKLKVLVHKHADGKYKVNDEITEVLNNL